MKGGREEGRRGMFCSRFEGIRTIIMGRRGGRAQQNYEAEHSQEAKPHEHRSSALFLPSSISTSPGYGLVLNSRNHKRWALKESHITKIHPGPENLINKMLKPLFVTKVQSPICTLKYPYANIGLLSSGSCCLETTFKTLF